MLECILFWGGDMQGCELEAVAVIMVCVNTLFLRSYPTLSIFPFKEARME